METDLCTCGYDRKAHKQLMADLAAAARPGASPASIEVDGCMDFKLDRRATWLADREGKRTDHRRMGVLTHGCRVCGMATVTYAKRPNGTLYHLGCKGGS